ncbi:hypothetical protein WJX72_011342 [[Myrmecia] bisecta]|uniref:DNA2/NAM7 helicase helicase domain-containing protein n=1 Tax=[Myrmecia] bisecta TaxID=41462 RepID=A0AAW1QBD7_9CHLO
MQTRLRIFQYLWRHCRAASHRLTLIHGPPSTGKTTTIAQLVLLLLRQRKARLRPAIPVVSKELHKYTLEVQEGVQSQFGFQSRKVKKAVQGAMVVFATCAGAGSALLASQRFAMVVVDEATQVTEPCALIPVLHKAEQLVLYASELEEDVSRTVTSVNTW